MIVKDKKKNKVKAKMGRPTVYTEELATSICFLISQGISLKIICKEKDMPDKSNVFRWMQTNTDFRDKYRASKEECMDSFADEIIDIADETIELVRKGAEKKSSAYVQAMKLKIETRRWLMSKLKVKKYGDKLDLTSGDKEIKGNTIIFTSFKDEAKGK